MIGLLRIAFGWMRGSPPIDYYDVGSGEYGKLDEKGVSE
jgi:hypothetical protein